ncbi:MAG TPA: hypothetical protein VFU54_16680 [Actinomycetota bacterium]|nr:hypothetical protein [Actinomycetota bacterium]
MAQLGLLDRGRHLGQQRVDVGRRTAEGDVDLVAGVLALAVVDLEAQVHERLVGDLAQVRLNDGHATAGPADETDGRPWPCRAPAGAR